MTWVCANPKCAREILDEDWDEARRRTEKDQVETGVEIATVAAAAGPLCPDHLSELYEVMGLE